MSLFGSTLGMNSRGRTRIDLLGTEHASVEEKSVHLLHMLKSGDITIADLMGPLYGRSGLTPDIQLPRGAKARCDAAADAEFLPLDSEHNILLQAHIHPHNYLNPTPLNEDYDLVVIGAGVSGLISVIIGAWLGDSRCVNFDRAALH